MNSGWGWGGHCDLWLARNKRFIVTFKYSLWGVLSSHTECSLIGAGVQGSVEAAPTLRCILATSVFSWRSLPAWVCRLDILPLWFFGAELTCFYTFFCTLAVGWPLRKARDAQYSRQFSLHVGKWGPSSVTLAAAWVCPCPLLSDEWQISGPEGHGSQLALEQCVFTHPLH